MADHVACLASARALAVGVAFVLALASASPAAADDSADRLIFWLDCAEVVELTDAELDAWKDRGVDGFACMIGHLRGMGGVHDFDRDPNASLNGPQYEFHRALRDSNIAGRAAARGMKLYLGMYLVNYWNRSTPFAEWFDDAAWSQLVLQKVGDLAAAARNLGFAGLAFDQELYPQEGGATSATWAWDYPGNTHSESEVRAQASHRGRELMRTVIDQFPGVEIMAYNVLLPQTWGELVQEEVNGLVNTFVDGLDVDFWDGLSSVEGYSAIRLVDAAFYKTPSPSASWDAALRYHYNSLYSYLSRELSNWEYASSRFFVTPFSWIDEGPCECPYEAARSPAAVADQLQAFRKWGMGGEFANFAYAGLHGFDYGPYEQAVRAASRPGWVDDQAPSIRASEDGEIRGTAEDNLAVKSVRWWDDRNGSGVAELRWDITGGSTWTGYHGETSWSISARDVSPDARSVTVIAEDIKGHDSQKLVIPVDDARPPQTEIVQRPGKRSSERVQRFRFRADEPATFSCKIDRRAWRPCRDRAAYRLGRGHHRFMVKAVDRAGNADPSPARKRFRISP